MPINKSFDKKEYKSIAAVVITVAPLNTAEKQRNNWGDTLDDNYKLPQHRALRHNQVPCLLKYPLTADNPFFYGNKKQEIRVIAILQPPKAREMLEVVHKKMPRALAENNESNQHKIKRTHQRQLVSFASELKTKRQTSPKNPKVNTALTHQDLLKQGSTLAKKDDR